MEELGISKLDLKRYNRMEVLKVLASYGTMSRVDISRVLKLTRAAITILVNELIEKGVLIDLGESSYIDVKPIRGRRKILVDINPNYKFCFGVSLDGDVINIGLTNLKGETLSSRTKTMKDPRNLDLIISQMTKGMEEIKSENCLKDDRIFGVGICISKEMCYALNMPTKNNKYDFSQINQRLSQTISFPCLAGDLNESIALANIDFYADKNKPKSRDLVLFSYRKRLDGTIVLENKIHSGFKNEAGSFSDLLYPISESQTVKLDDLVSENTLARAIDNMFSAEKTPFLHRKLNGVPVGSGHKVLANPELLEDESIKELIVEAAKKVAVAINNILKILDIDRVIFFGELIENPSFEKYFTETLGQCLSKSQFSRLEISNISTKTSYLAGSSLAFREFFIKTGGIC